MKRHVRVTLAAACLAIAVSLCAGCAPKNLAASAEPQGDATDTSPAAVEIDWSPEADCGVCHSTQAGSLQDASCMASLHANEEAGCLACHEATADLETAHEGATTEGAAAVKTLKSTKIPDDACLVCHAKDGIAEKTAGSTILTDTQGTVVNPHALPENEDHAAATCRSCHTAHDGKPVSETAPLYCRSCHHQDVYECGTCHE